jgi:prepilin-type N-terminal cleavage/methylation domain-containing protein
MQKQQKGFTIIEVLIVLAIAGLILLIVFLAVPALQRNSRNTQRKSDVSALLGATNEYIANHQGQIPTTLAQLQELVSNAKLGYYVDGFGLSGKGKVGLAFSGYTLPENADNDRAVLAYRAKCKDDGSTEAGTAKQISILYLIETSGGWTSTCQSG